MPSEKLKYAARVKKSETLFYNCWSDEEGDRSLRISHSEGELVVQIKKEWGGSLDLKISRSDAQDIIRGLQGIL